MSEPTKDFNVAIVGGGMCGLLCAIGLARSGIQVHLFEAAPKFEEIGAGVDLGTNAIRALDGLGVLEAVLARSEEPRPTKRPFKIIAGVGNHEHIFDYEDSATDLGLAIYRPAFLEALMPLIDARLVHFNKRCISITDAKSGHHILHFSDGDTYEAVLVVGADGIKSVTRNFVVGDTHQPVYSNTAVYRALVSAGSPELAGIKNELKSRSLCWVGQDKHIITFPVQAERFVNIVVFASKPKDPVVRIDPPWVRPGSAQEMMDDYSLAGWGEDAMILLKAMKNPSKWYLHSLNPPLETFVRQKIVLIGDAAHAMLPHLGAGVGQGFEDVYALCKFLGHPKTKADNLDNALKAYNSIRVPRANMVLERSTTMGQIYESCGAAKSSISETRRRLPGMWEPVWHHDLAKEVETVIEN